MLFKPINLRKTLFDDHFFKNQLSMIPFLFPSSFSLFRSQKYERTRSGTATGGVL